MGRTLNRRRFLQASLGALGAAVATGCAAATPQGVQQTAPAEAATPAVAPEEKKTVVVYECCWGERHITAGKALYEEFRRNRPDLDVKDFWPFGDPGWMETLLAKTAANEQIDIIWWCASHHKFAEEGRLLDLKPLLEADANYNLDAYQATGVDFCYDLPGREGPLWALPTNYATVLLYYNKNMFDAAGVSYPDENWTWDDLLVAAQALTKVGDDGEVEEWGFAMGSDPWYYEPVIESWGGGIVEVDGDGCLLNRPESVEALQWLQDLLHKHKVEPMPENTAAMGEDAMFISNKLAMCTRPEWGQLNFMPAHESEGLEYGVALYPQGAKGRKTNYWAGITSITSMAQSPQAAWEVAKFITGDTYQRTMTVFIPESPSARIETALYGFTEYMQYPEDRSALIESPKYGDQFFNIARYGKEMSDIIGPALDPMWLGQVAPADVVDDICAQVNAKIAELRGG